MEWSFYVETELFIEFSLSWFTFPFVSVDNIPLLVDSIVIVVYTNVSVFSINITNNFKNLALFIDN